MRRPRTRRRLFSLNLKARATSVLILWSFRMTRAPRQSLDQTTCNTSPFCASTLFHGWPKVSKVASKRASTKRSPIMFVTEAFQQDPIRSVLSHPVIRQLLLFASFSLSYSIFSSQTHSPDANRLLYIPSLPYNYTCPFSCSFLSISHLIRLVLKLSLRILNVMELETVDLRDGTLTQLTMSTHRDGTP